MMLLKSYGPVSMSSAMGLSCVGTRYASNMTGWSLLDMASFRWHRRSALDQSPSCTQTRLGAVAAFVLLSVKKSLSSAVNFENLIEDFPWTVKLFSSIRPFSEAIQITKRS